MNVSRNTWELAAGLPLSPYTVQTHRKLMAPSPSPLRFFWEFMLQAATFINTDPGLNNDNTNTVKLPNLPFLNYIGFKQTSAALAG